LGRDPFRKHGAGESGADDQPIPAWHAKISLNTAALRGSAQRLIVQFGRRERCGEHDHAHRLIA
jgi:hypothetical protein